MLDFYFNNPTKLLFGSGKLARLSKQALPGKKALLLISAGKSAALSGALPKTEEQLKLAGVSYVIFNKIVENPLRSTVMEAAAFARENGCDFIVAVGGGAVLDSASAIAAMVTNEGDLWDYIQGGTGGRKRLKERGIPIVTIPTTAGTGSEINCWGVISNPETNEKIGFGEESVIPVLSIVDPTLMTSVPPKYTAFQGFDALFHNTESMISNCNNPPAEAIALSCIERIAAYLPRAVRDGNDLEARENVAYGSTMAGVTMQLASTTAKHAMEHAMSAYHRNLPHGAGLIILSLPYYDFFIQKHVCDEQFVKMARAMGKRDASRPEEFLTALEELQRACGVFGLKMSDYGFARTESRTLARGAREMQGGLFAANPCEMTEDECTAIFEEAYL